MNAMSVRRPYVGIATLWLIGAIAIALLGAVTGVQIGANADTVLHDTYYVVAHAGFSTSIVVAFLFFAAFYALVPKAVGRDYSRVLATSHFAATSLGVGLVLSPQYLLAVQGMPERYVDYSDAFALWNTISTAGYVVSGIGLIIFGVVLAQMFLRRRGEDAS